MKKTRFFALANAFAFMVAIVLLMAGCAQGAGDIPGEPAASPTTSAATPELTAAAAQQTAAVDAADMFTDRDYEIGYDESESAVIQLSGDTAGCESDAVSITGSVVTIADEGTYILRGALEDGMIIINAEKTDKLQLVLDNVSINSASSAAIYILQADKVFITLAPDSQNALSNGGEFVAIDENNIDAVIFSKDDLTLNGEGALKITTDAGHGIVSKDDLVIASGSYDISASGHAMAGKDSVRIAEGSLTLTSGKDGIHAENSDDAALGYMYIAGGSFAITSQGDGLSAGAYLIIDGGEFVITSGGGSANATEKASDGFGGFGGSRQDGDRQDGNRQDGGGFNRANGGDGARPSGAPEMPSGGAPDGTIPGSAASGTAASASEDATLSAKGIKATLSMTLSGGSYAIDSADDALHSNGDLTVNGGTYELYTGDDGIHADAAVVISGGRLNILKSYEGIEGLTIDIAGGEIDLVASDDGLNAAGGNDASGFGGFGGFGGDMFASNDDCSITISGGTLRINASGDGIDSNGSLSVTGGETYVSGPTDGANGALDYNGSGSISGGIFVAAGSTGMAMSLSPASAQGVIFVTTGAQSANSVITLLDGEGATLVEWTADKEYQCAVISCPGILDGGTYTLSAGDSITDITMDGLSYGSNGTFGGGFGGGFGGKKQ